MKSWQDRAQIQRLATTIAMIKALRLRNDLQSRSIWRDDLWEIQEVRVRLYRKGSGEWLMTIVSDGHPPIRYYSKTPKESVMRLFTEIK